MMKADRDESALPFPEDPTRKAGAASHLRTQIDADDITVELTEFDIRPRKTRSRPHRGLAARMPGIGGADHTTCFAHPHRADQSECSHESDSAHGVHARHGRSRGRGQLEDLGFEREHEEPVTRRVERKAS